MRYAINLSINNNNYTLALVQAANSNDHIFYYTASFPSQIGVGINLIVTVDATGCNRLTLRIDNNSSKALCVSQVQIGILHPLEAGIAHYFASNWGCEFDPLTMYLPENHALQVLAGRSGKGHQPWLGLSYTCDFYSLALAWSGNWKISTQKLEKDLAILLGIPDIHFAKTLAVGEVFCSPAVYVAHSAQNLECACLALRNYFYQHHAVLDKARASLPVVWNSWWEYEDKKLNEDVVYKNAVLARDLGFTHVMLDAGWFGDSLDGIGWYDKRGDWDIENKKDFPSGLAALGKKINALGIKFGIWCEIEAIAPHAKLTVTHPEFCAVRHGKQLGYICLGNKAAQDWAYTVLKKLIVEYGVQWTKLDFNLDPHEGCNSLTHGHDADDGLYAHYQGYYALLDRVRNEFPHVVLENCSSGGLRIDLGMLEHTQLTFLSDPDYMEHHFQVFWGATSFIHPALCYHFTQSETNFVGHNDLHRPIQAEMSPAKFDYYIRGGMVCAIGFCHALIEWPGWCRERLARHIEFYKQISKKYIMEGNFYRLTGQAMRGMLGDRWQAYQYSARDSTVLVLAFRLKNAGAEKMLKLFALEPTAVYIVTFSDANVQLCMSGADLMNTGFSISFIKEENSEVIWIKKREGESGNEKNS